jgi:hypothetical protein
MVSDSEDTSLSSSGEEEDHGKRKEKRHMNRNLNGLACMAVKELVYHGA